MEPLSREELMALPVMTTIEMAARTLCLGRTRAYELARREEFPCKVIRIGTSYRVVTADLHRIAGIHPNVSSLGPTRGGR
jgi:hypothetical protein